VLVQLTTTQSPVQMDTHNFIADLFPSAYFSFSGWVGKYLKVTMASTNSTKSLTHEHTFTNYSDIASVVVSSL